MKPASKTRTTDAVLFWTGMAAATLLLVGAVAIIGFLLRPTEEGEDLGQPRVERLAQRRLPQSTDPVWNVLRQTRVREDDRSGTFTAEFPSAVQSLSGRQITVEGYMLPLDSKHLTNHFLLSKYTPVCPFCPPGQPNEVIEVYSSDPMVPSQDKIAVMGRFGVHQDSGAGLFFRLDGADVHTN